MIKSSSTFVKEAERFSGRHAKSLKMTNMRSSVDHIGRSFFQYLDSFAVMAIR